MLWKCPYYDDVKHGRTHLLVIAVVVRRAQIVSCDDCRAALRYSKYRVGCEDRSSVVDRCHGHATRPADHVSTVAQDQDELVGDRLRPVVPVDESNVGVEELAQRC